MSSNISIHFVKAAVRGAVQQGYDLETLLNKAGIFKEQLENPDAQVTPQQMATIFKAVWIITDDEFMGLGENKCKLGTFRLLAGMLIRYNRLESLLRYAENFYYIVRDDILFKIEKEKNTVRVIVDVECGDFDPDNLLKEYYLVAWQRYICWLIDTRIEWLSTTFNYPEPKHQDLYKAMFPGKTQFSQDHCSFSFDSKYLKKPIRKSRIDVKHYLTQLPLPIIVLPETETLFASRVRQVFRTSDITQLPDLNTIARALSVNPRTVHRKLTNEGTSFQEIKDQYRCDVAARCLSEKNMKVKDVSEYLGFSEPAAFCHFFKKVAGLTPSMYTQFTDL